MDTTLVQSQPELWGGMECTINRVGDKYRDQLFETRHYSRQDDFEIISKLNIKAIRYPVLWERYEPDPFAVIDWSKANRDLAQLHQQLNIKPIVGLLHHGSGPAYTSLIDPEFPAHFARYAEQVSRQFPWVDQYTPVNEPLTTARFSGLYGLWYPHHKNALSFLTMLMNQLKGVILAMQRIRRINPDAKLIQTEDLCKVYSTPELKYQADFENDRRWLSYDLLCGRVDQNHPMWSYLLSVGVSGNDLQFFIDNPCTPDTLGLNYYVTSERFLDHRCDRYPHVLPGNNGIHQYVDVEAFRTGAALGLGELLKEVWARYGIKIAITEAHLACTREEQMRWFKEIWDTSCKAKSDGIDMVGVTAWALFGAYDWNSLLTKNAGHYESGAFDVGLKVRATALSKMISKLGERGDFQHALLNNQGWWHGSRDISIVQPNHQPLLIIGKNGALATAFGRLCLERGIPHVALSRNDIDITDEKSVVNVIDVHGPWGIVNASGYTNVDYAECQPRECYLLNTSGPMILAKACRQKGIPFMTFSSDQVFSGDKRSPYEEHDLASPVNHYGLTKARAESLVSTAYPSALIVRTSAFFGPWDDYNFAHDVLSALKNNVAFSAANDVIISPTYVPHLVHAALDLFIDEEDGIWHLSNEGGAMSWSEFARELATRGGYSNDLLISKRETEMNWAAKRPTYSALQSGKGVKLPSLEHAVTDYFNSVKIQ